MFSEAVPASAKSSTLQARRAEFYSFDVRQAGTYKALQAPTDPHRCDHLRLLRLSVGVLLDMEAWANAFSLFKVVTSRKPT